MSLETRADAHGGQLAGIDAWEHALDEVLRDSSTAIRPNFQPIVDLHRGVVAGYEMLARFDHPLGSSPAQWFGAASVLGRIEELDQVMLGVGIEALSSLPANTFLSVNLSGSSAGSNEILSLIRNGPHLGPMVIEITEQTDLDDPQRLGLAAEIMRERGAMLAIDDAGAGYANLQRIINVRPDFIKLDRSLISDIHVDETKAAATEMMGSLASRIDAWIVAEGVERPAELQRLAQLRVPLAQGFLMARPSENFEHSDPSWAERAREYGAGREASLLPVLERVRPALAEAAEEEIGWRFADDATLEHLPLITEENKITGLLDRDGYRMGASEIVMRVELTAAPSDVLRRAMTRPRRARIAPIVCCDEFGRYLGLIKVERLVELVSA